MKFTELIEQFAKNYSHLSIQCDEVGVVRFLVGENRLIYMRSSLDEASFFLYAKVGELPKTDSEKIVLYQQLLEANLFGDGVGVACLAIHQESGSIILTQTFDALYTDYEAFEKAYKSFLEYLNYWCDKCAGLKAQIPESDSTNDPEQIHDLNALKYIRV